MIGILKRFATRFFGCFARKLDEPEAANDPMSAFGGKADIKLGSTDWLLAHAISGIQSAVIVSGQGSGHVKEAGFVRIKFRARNRL